ncbi:barstar family protein [Paenalcaligenes hominis]|uniref:barstar family protein n=1 Tax=Paenalcaligenes hominis TaxID=643674 RepID=UPI003525863F
MSQATLQALLQNGGLIEATESQQEGIFALAQAADITSVTVECDRARSRSAVLRAIVKAVDFPEFFGNDLDALYDCLCDTVVDQKAGLYIWFNKLHTGDPALADDAQAIISVCNDVADFASNKGRYFAYTVIHAGKHPDPDPGIAPTPYSGMSEE